MTVASKPIRTVLVDDAGDIRHLIRLLLERSGAFTVVGEAADGADGVDVVHSTRPDLILLDMAMPVMDALQALPLLRRVSPDSVVVMLSGLSASGVADEAIARGAVAYIEKGTTPKTIPTQLLQIMSDPAGTTATQEAADATTVNPTPADVYDALLEEVLAVLSHEMLNPIAAISGFTEILHSSRHDLSPETVEECFLSIERSTRHLQTLVMKFADSGRVGRNRLELHMQMVDVGDTVHEVVTDLRTLTATHPIDVDVASSTIVALDPMRLRQVITNLVTNAAKFSEPGSPIAVTVDIEGESVTIAVTDHGPGIPAERRHELFKKFSRLGSGREGTGIGLYLSKAIALEHGGDILVESTEGRGSCFTVVLPLNQPLSTGR